MECFRRGRRVFSITRIKPKPSYELPIGERWRLRYTVRNAGGSWRHVLRFLCTGDSGPIFRYEQETKR
jgi:hypothetical protein